MSNFCGYINKDKKIYDEKYITNMNIKLNNNLLKNIYIDKYLAFGNGIQPMKKIINEKEYIIMFDGNLYNSLDLKKYIKDKGYSFDTKQDAEIILYLYVEYGPSFLNFLNGIYSICIYDKNESKTFFARDRLGVKPLFYTLTNDTFIFATKIKAILAHPDITPVLDKEGLI